MRVLHVSLGLPPLRTGGLTRYCTDVMLAQAEAGDEVSLLYPGRFLPGRTRISRSSWRGVETFEIVNPLPVPLTFGVAEPGPFCSPCDGSGAYERLLDEARPDVIHVHSFQGVHREFFEAVRARGIPSVFTTHDYFPFCPRCTLVTSEGLPCQEGPSPERCAACNAGVGMTLRRSRAMQSRLYARMKGSALARKAGAAVKGRMSRGGEGPARSMRPEPPGDMVEGYRGLLSYERGVFGLLGLTLANSSVSLDAYRRQFPEARCETLHITHAGLSRHAPRPARSGRGPWRVGYFGGKRAYKGYGVLLDACDILASQCVDFELRLYGDDYGDVDGLNFRCIDCGHVPPEKVPEALVGLDIVAVPSTYPETFGFVVLEALSEGTCSVCSDAVGARDLLPPERVFRAGSAHDLARCMGAAMAQGCLPGEVPADYPLPMDAQLERLKSAYIEAACFSGR